MSRIIPISVEQYDRMIDQGILPEGAPIELLDGLLVLKDRSKAGEDIVTMGSAHVWSVKAIGRVDARLGPLGYHMQTQAPVIVSGYREPEPDGAVLVGTADDYLRRKPTAADAPALLKSPTAHWIMTARPSCSATPTQGLGSTSSSILSMA